ncbi:DUF1836 domain-containing protein [Ectobacillus antri]|jgi:hypothetical protein|uniref:DUF1836 domain-containing protein n=1 Tax=Ectobacillus antri TaxID=2486280 RepID=A0ABT6H4G9_9BACI|nr:DUF1836 domain-containing protein [Ectobacillus antri]MDG4657017.1 DUF1836 domain-containing protein [Ectobacillus antri]MDG5754119.1 DUF1836 domain-containing protein [Ectobacillus antri]
MITFLLTRKEMANLLLSLKGWHEKQPLTIMQEAWRRTHKEETINSLLAGATLSPVLEKIMRTKEQDIGFSLTEISALGNQIENTNFSLTALQNWVKRDVKEMISTPQRGKKYALEQVALLFIVEDLKTALDFESIRKLLQLIVNDPDNRDDDLINPIFLYEAYSSLFEELTHNDKVYIETDKSTIACIEETIKAKAAELAMSFPNTTETQREAIRNVIIIATLSVHTAYFQMMAKRYLSATLFLQNMQLSHDR